MSTLTLQIKGYPFEVRIAAARTSAVLADQVKNLDWAARGVLHKGKVTPAELAEVGARIHALIGKSRFVTGHAFRRAAEDGF